MTVIFRSKDFRGRLDHGKIKGKLLEFTLLWNGRKFDVWNKGNTQPFPLESCTQMLIHRKTKIHSHLRFPLRRGSPRQQPATFDSDWFECHTESREPTYNYQISSNLFSFMCFSFLRSKHLSRLFPVFFCSSVLPFHSYLFSVFFFFSLFFVPLFQTGPNMRCCLRNLWVSEPGW